MQTARESDVTTKRARCRYDGMKPLRKYVSAEVSMRGVENKDAQDGCGDAGAVRKSD
jgi:hypothetical protein